MNSWQIIPSCLNYPIGIDDLKLLIFPTFINLTKILVKKKPILAVLGFPVWPRIILIVCRAEEDMDRTVTPFSYWLEEERKKW